MKPDELIPVPVENIPDFWERLTNAPAAFLALDYDGTLAPFQIDRMRAFPLSGISRLLERINTKTRGGLAIVSGRAIAEIETLLPLANLTLIGAHGFEIKRPGAEIIRREPKPIQAQGLALARIRLEQDGDERLLEIKPAGIALHTRGLSFLDARTKESTVTGLFNDLAYDHDLEIRGFDGGIELRARGWHKGDAVRELISGLKTDTFIVFIGDDETDEDVFRTLGTEGLGIRVGSDERPSAAHGRLKNIEDVRGFLACWLAMAPPGKPKGGSSWISAG